MTRVSAKGERGMKGLTSIIIVTWNGLEYTRQCIDSLEKYTRLPHELIIVDNGSTDGTVELLHDYAARRNNVRIILNQSNLGFAKAANQGLMAAEGDYLVLLNNDTVVTENWLENLQTCAESDPQVGMVGPRSNYVSGPQQLDVSYNTLSEMHRFARQFNFSDNTRWFEVKRLVGFCLLIKREAYQKVGGLDERFALGNFEDDDLSLRMRESGYRLLCAGDTFIHHYGEATFKVNQVDYSRTMQENARRFLEKWGQVAERDDGPKILAAPKRTLSDNPNNSNPIQVFRNRFLKNNPWLYPEQSPLLSLCMIVKDEEENLPRCLASIQGVVDEIIVVDTGSSDRTVEIARSFGARVFYHPWSGNFSEARNISLEKARGRWILVLDADEELVKEDGPKLRALIEDTDKDGFLLRETNYIGEKAGLEAVLNPAFRLFRNHPKYRFRGAVHEQILSAVQENGGQIEAAPIRLNHYGYLNQVTIDKNKIQRNLEIILRAVEKNPKDSFMRFNLGVEYLRLRDPEKALENFKASFLNLRGLDVGYASVLVRNIVLCLHQLKRYEEALKVIEDAEPAYPDFTDLEYLRGLIQFDLGKYSEAIETFRRCLEKGESAERHISQQGVGSFKAGYSLGLAYKQLGDKANAVKALVNVLKKTPRYYPALEEVSNLLMEEEEPERVVAFLGKLIEKDDGEALSILAAALEARGKGRLALEFMERALTLSGDTSLFLFRKGEILLGLKEYEAAYNVLASIKPTAQFYGLGQLEKALVRILAGQVEDGLLILAGTTVDQGTAAQKMVYQYLGERLLGREDEAQQIATKVALEKPDFEPIVWGLLIRLLRWREFDAFEKAIGLLDFFADVQAARKELGKIYYRMGFYESAAEELIASFQTGVYDAEAMVILAAIAKEKGLPAEAEDFYRAALELDPHRVEGYTGLTSLLSNQGRYREAVALLENGAVFLPHSEVINSLRQSLEPLALGIV